MAANGISELATKEERQQSKLDLAALNRSARGNARAAYDITQLPSQYSGNNLTDNANSGGLVEGRPWIIGSPSISLAFSGPSDVNEGSAYPYVFSIGGLPNGTYYWTIETNAGDFEEPSGSFSVTGNTGTFTVTATADLTTEGTETFGLAVRLGSIIGSILIQFTGLNINDTSQTP